MILNHNLAPDNHSGDVRAHGAFDKGFGDVEFRRYIRFPPIRTTISSRCLLIAASTRRLTGGLFEYRNLGDELKGIATPVPAWQALRPSALASRFEALRGSALSPLVGRDEEIDLLLRRWARAKAGNGQVVLPSGEPGIGKSRIVAALIERLRNEPHLTRRGSSNWHPLRTSPRRALCHHSA
jgi:hypothetical protein